MWQVSGKVAAGVPMGGRQLLLPSRHAVGVPAALHPVLAWPVAENIDGHQRGQRVR